MRSLCLYRLWAREDYVPLSDIRVLYKIISTTTCRACSRLDWGAIRVFHADLVAYLAKL